MLTIRLVMITTTSGISPTPPPHPLQLKRTVYQLSQTFVQSDRVGLCPIVLLVFINFCKQGSFMLRFCSRGLLDNREKRMFDCLQYLTPFLAQFRHEQQQPYQ